MRALLIAAVIAVWACRPRVPTADVDPVAEADARAFVPTLASVAAPCDSTKLDALIDHDALAAKYASHLHVDGRQRDAMVAAIASRRSGTTVLCEWFNAAHNSRYKLLSVDAEARPLVRRLALEPGAKASGVSYFRFELGKSRRDGVVRIVDAYSYIEGEWLTAILAQVSDAALERRPDDAFKLASVMKKMNELRAAHQPGQALVMLDTLSPALKAVRNMRLLRIAVAKEIGQTEWLRELDAVTADLPNDPSVAMLQIDATLLRKDYAATQRYIDIIDKEVGGDPFQNAVRSTVALQQGDVAAAARYANAAATAEPDLVRAQLARLDAVVAQKDWPTAIATLTKLESLGQHVNDAKLREHPSFAELVASPEYQAYLAGASTTPSDRGHDSTSSSTTSPPRR